LKNSINKTLAESDLSNPDIRDSLDKDITKVLQSKEEKCKQGHPSIKKKDIKEMMTELSSGIITSMSYILRSNSSPNIALRSDNIFVPYRNSYYAEVSKELKHQNQDQPNNDSLSTDIIIEALEDMKKLFKPEESSHTFL